MTLDASGNLGIGTTSPIKTLHVHSASNTTTLVTTGGGNSQFRGYAIGSNSGDSTEYGSLKMELNSGELRLTSGSSGFGGVTTFYTNGSERARIDSNGNFMVGTTTYGVSNVGFGVSPAGRSVCAMSSSTSGATTLEVYSTGAGAFRFYVNMAGTVFATNTTISGISDQRLKENIRDLDEGLATVMALKPRKFDWKAGKGKDIKDDRGFIAQEFEQVLPDMIDTWKDSAPEGEEPYKAVNANLIPTLVKALQEQQTIIESQSVAIEALKARLDAANL
jgi:hypothetical protein